MSWTSQDARDFVALVNPDPDVPVFKGPHVPNLPDKIVVVNGTKGAGLTMEGIGDQPGMQVLVRGPQNGSAEQYANDLDMAIWLGSYEGVIGIQRAGGRPAPLDDLDAGRREIYTTNYIIHVLTGV